MFTLCTLYQKEDPKTLVGKSITLEFSNASSADVKIYANEGVVQLLFFEGEACETTYADRGGKYQNQGSGVTLPKV